MNTSAATAGTTGVREELLSYLRAWARHGVHFGVSCTWRMLGPHAGIFNTACIDAGPHTLPALLRATQQIPPEFRLSCVLSHESMTYRFPHRHPDPAKRGTVNAHFLNAEPVREYLSLLGQPGAPHTRLLLLPVDHIYRTEGVDGVTFLDALTRFLAGLPPQHRYAVELHNREYLLPEYFDMLCARNITHVLNGCTTMPTILDQIQLPRILTAGVVAVRTASYVNGDTLLGVRETIRRCIDERRALYVYIDGEAGHDSAAGSMTGLLTMLNPDLAKLSPIKKRAA